MTSATSFQPRYAYDRSDNKGPSDFDIRHNFVFNYSYELLFGRSSTGAARAATVSPKGVTPDDFWDGATAETGALVVLAQ